MLYIHRHYINEIFSDESLDNLYSDSDSSSSDSQNTSNETENNN